MKFSWRHFGLLLAAGFSLNCFKEPLSPVLPTWDVTATFPVGTRTYTFGDLVAKDTSLLKAGTGSQVSFSTSARVAPTYVSDLLVLNPKDTTVQFAIGAFSVATQDQRQAIAIPWLPQGQTIPIRDTSFALADIQSTIGAFQSIVVKSGTMQLTLENNLPVALDVLAPVRFVDISGNEIATFIFNPSTIPAHGSRTATDDLASKSFSNAYRITGLQFHTPGSPTPVTIPTGDLLVATISTANLKARQATLASIPAQHLVDNDTAHLRMDDSTFVRELFIKSGSLGLTFTNNVALPMTFKFRFEELQRRSGSSYTPYEDSLYLGPLATGTMVLNLANTRMYSLNSTLINSIGVRGSVTILPATGFTSISETDRVSIVVRKNSAVVVDSAIAVVKPTFVGVDLKVPLKLGKGIQKFSGQLNLPSAQMILSTLSSVGFPSDALVRIGARKVTGDSVFLSVPYAQRRVTPGQDEIRFDGPEVGQFLSQLAGRFPDSLRLYGRLLVNPPDVYTPSPAGLGTVASSSSVSGTASLSIPLTLGVVGGTVRDTLIIGDTTNNGSKASNIKSSYIGSYNNGKLMIELENGLPADIAFNTALLNHQKNSLMNLPQSGQMIRLAGARVDANGNVVEPTRSTTVIQLNQQEVAQYNPSEFVSYAVVLNTSSGSSTVQFKTDQQIKIRMWMQASGRIR